MKKIFKDLRDVHKGKNKVFLRLPMKYIPKENLELALEAQEQNEKHAFDGNIPAKLNLIMLNQMMIWNKIK